jgi:hypothetical protein
MVFKKDLTPIGGKRGVVSKVNGKGAAERQPQVLPQITGRYPKTAPAPAPTPMPMTPMVPPEKA